MTEVDIKTVENSEKYRFFHAMHPRFSKQWFKRNAPDTIIGAGPGVFAYDRGFTSISNNTKASFNNEIIYVGSSLGYLSSLSKRNQHIEFTNCTFLIDECADLEWLKLCKSCLKLHLCSFIIVKNPIVSDNAPICGYTSGVRMVLLYWHCGILNIIKHLKGMSACTTSTDINEMNSSYNLCLGKGVWTKYDYLKGYLWLKAFLIKQGYPDLLKGPIDQFPTSDLLALFGKDFKIILPE